MVSPLRLAGAGMAVGGILFFTRMAPIFAAIPEDMDFPPTGATDLARLAELAGPAWPISHAMGLVGVVLFTLGYWAHANALAKAGHRVIGRIAALIASLAFGLFSIALIIDGFVLTAAVSENAPLSTVAAVHENALRFFTPGVFLMFIAIGVLSSRMLHGFIHARWLGAIGTIIAIAGPTAYLFGVAGPNWDNMQIGGSAMMLAFVWHLMVGVVALFSLNTRP